MTLYFELLHNILIVADFANPKQNSYNLTSFEVVL